MSCGTESSNVVHVSRHRGDSLRLTVDLGGEGGSEIDASGWLWLAQVRKDGVLMQTMEVTPIDPIKGVIEVGLTSAQTTAMAVDDYDFDVQCTDQAADVRTIVTGRLRIKEDVSR
jgi:hypothetical protein